MIRKNNMKINAEVGEIKTIPFYGRMEIISVVDDDNITVQFTDGKIIETTYERFINSTVRLPIHEITFQAKDYQSKAIKSIINSEMINDTVTNYDVVYSHNGKKNWRVGEIHKANNGQKLKIVGYNGCNKITVLFEDGTIVPNRKYCHILKGEVKNPATKNKVMK